MRRQQQGQGARPEGRYEALRQRRHCGGHSSELRQRANNHRESFGFWTSFHTIQACNSIWAQGING
jgi:hypothetical protein